MRSAILRKVSRQVAVEELRKQPSRARECIATLDKALTEFRAVKGFGRGIAANQVGFDLRIIMLNLGEGNFPLVNPKITQKSKETFTIFDDCMSVEHGELLVRVERSEHVEVAYLDGDGEERIMAGHDSSVSELLQHEIDHLDGVLMIDRAKAHAESGISSVARQDFESKRSYYAGLCDHTITPTIH